MLAHDTERAHQAQVQSWPIIPRSAVLPQNTVLRQQLQQQQQQQQQQDHRLAVERFDRQPEPVQCGGTVRQAARVVAVDHPPRVAQGQAPSDQQVWSATGEEENTDVHRPLLPLLMECD